LRRFVSNASGTWLIFTTGLIQRAGNFVRDNSSLDSRYRSGIIIIHLTAALEDCASW
jgi:hypothetical protein